MLSLQVDAPEEGALVKSAQSALAVVQAITIDSPEMFEAAGMELRGIKQKIEALESQRVKLVKPLNDTVKNINDLFRKPLALLNDASSALRGTMLTYQDEQDRIRREAEDKARRLAEAEQARLREEAAERDRLAREEAARLQAKAAESTSRAEAQALEQRAHEVQQQGAAEAATLRDTADIVTAAPVAVMAPKAAGISTRETYKAEVTDKQKLVAYIAAHPDFLNLLDVNATALNQMAKALKSNLNLPGVRAYPDRGIAARKVAA